MSQYKLKGNTPNGPVDVLLGWDEPMSWFFMVIEPDADEPLYSNLYEPEAELLTLEHFQGVLERFGITNIALLPGHKSGLYELLMEDRNNKKMH